MNGRPPGRPFAYNGGMSDTSNESSKHARAIKLGAKPLRVPAPAQPGRKKPKRPMADIIRELQSFKWNFEQVERR